MARHHRIHHRHPEAPRSATSARSTCSTSNRVSACASAPRAAAASATRWNAIRRRCARTCATASCRQRRPRTPTAWSSTETTGSTMPPPRPEERRFAPIAAWTEPPAFSFGEAREAYERRWTATLQDALHSAIVHLPGLLRQVMHRRLELAIDARNRGRRICRRKRSSGHPRRARIGPCGRRGHPATPDPPTERSARAPGAPGPARLHRRFPAAAAAR